MPLVKTGYYDKPDGQDFFNKMLATNTYAGIVGLAWSTIDVLNLSHPKGYLPTIARFAYNIGPMMGMASAFTITTYALTNARGKDDMINYFFGGMAAGGVYGAWRRSHLAGLGMGAVFGIASMLKKSSKIDDWEFFPPVNGRVFRGVRDADYTKMRNPSKNYTTGEDRS